MLSKIESLGYLSEDLWASVLSSSPVVAFGATGLLDIVDHKINGYLAKPYDSKDLANGIDFLLNASNYDQLCNNARKKVIKHFDSSIVADKYEELYNQILDDRNNT